MSSISIFIFRRDYRLDDNNGLIECCKNSSKVYPIFIFTPEQIDDDKNSYKSHNSVKFLCDSLKELGHVSIFYGDNLKILEKLVNEWNVGAIYENADYTPYAKKRQGMISKFCINVGIKYFAIEDICLLPINSIQPAGKSHYSKFAPYYEQLLTKNILTPVRFSAKMKNQLIVPGGTISINSLGRFYNKDKIGDMVSLGGRNSGLKILSNIKNFSDYSDKRDQLIYNTTHLSAHIKYGTVSIREVYWAIVKESGLGKRSELLRQVIWHDFYNNLVFNKSETFNTNYGNHIKWTGKQAWFNAWKQGRTGFPIIDACMTELNKTGYLHNRGRMIVANFLVKILGINWKLGEKYFAKVLYDYDPIQNNMGWAGQSSLSGTESRPLNQSVLNPWIQSRKYDGAGEYIKKWLPEMKDINPSHLHQWDKYHSEYKHLQGPIVDYKTQRDAILEIYYKANK